MHPHSNSKPILLTLLFTAVLLGSIFLLRQSAAAAPVVFVRVDGDDYECNGLVDAPYPGGSGPRPCAYQTFWKAHSEVDVGGKIYVGPGTYGDVFSIGKSVSVFGSGVNQTIIDRAGSPRGIDVSGTPSIVVTISDLTVQNGVNAGPGGGVSIAAGMVTIQNVIIQDNIAHSGGAIENWGVLILDDCIIRRNTATGSFGGGGIYNLGTLVVEDSTVSDNHADSAAANGGGLINDNSASDQVKILRSTFSGNSAEQFGSAIHDQGEGDVLIVNSTVSGNTVNAAFGPGDGSISIGSNSTLEILFSTIAGNYANGVGVEGGIVTYGPVAISSSIIAWNDNAECTAAGSGSITSGGYNIDSGTDCGFTSSGDMQNTDPILDTLADNGGPTWTMALLPGSPATDATSDPACADPTVSGVDQRGVSRPIGNACDIGAYEATIDLFLPLIMK